MYFTNLANVVSISASRTNSLRSSDNDATGNDSIAATYNVLAGTAPSPLVLRSPLPSAILISNRYNFQISMNFTIFTNPY